MATATTREWLRGAVVAVPTPFHDDFSLDLDSLRRNIEIMIERGVRTGDGVLLVAGAGGEFPTLTHDERVAVMRTSVEAAAGRVPTVTSIQHTDMREVVRLAGAAEDAGIDGLQVGVPYYYPASPDDLFRVVERAGTGSSLPLMIYSTWWEGGLDIDGTLLRRLADLPHVEAVKWSAPTADRFAEGLAAIADRLVVIDNQGLHVWGHVLGATGFVTHLSNFWPEYPLSIWRALEARDYEAVPAILARFKWAWSSWAGRVASISGGEGPFIKAAMELAGFQVGPPRPPAVRPTPALMAELGELFDRADLPRLGRPVAAVVA
ncbi:MAG TPA: dihydrodipicolinate synthase family protein [Candidatus Limnocylindrales bacterium]